MGDVTPINRRHVLPMGLQAEVQAVTENIRNTAEQGPAYHLNASDLDLWAAHLHRAAREKGFWEGSPDTIPEKMMRLMLIVTELGEAAEALRTGVESDKLEGVSGELEELVDVVVRVFDYVGHYFPDQFGDAFYRKVTYNKDRPYKHGKKV